MTNRVSRREFIIGASATALSTNRIVAQSSLQRPNILFILADDLGYGDLSCYGRPDYRTPVLDELATQGLKFLSAYAAAPVCTPTRCAIVTGRYPQRIEVGVYEPLKADSLDKGLPPEHPTVASLLKANGYETALIGKWHLGWKPEFGPNRTVTRNSLAYSAGQQITSLTVPATRMDSIFGSPSRRWNASGT